jgi:hypothetical protein
MIVMDEGAHSELVQVIRCDFKPGSVKRSIDLETKRVCLSRGGGGQYFRIPLPMTIEKIHSGIPLYHILMVLMTFWKHSL